MSYDLCLLPQAKKPYYIENIRMNIYSLEELCFYLYNNACLIDESLLNERLLDWLRDELGLTRLYRQLYDQLEKKDGIGFLVLPIFREAGLSYDECHAGVSGAASEAGSAVCRYEAEAARRLSGQGADVRARGI